MLNAAGQVAFTANLTNTNGGNIDDSGIFRGDGATLVQIARESQALPDGTGNFGTLPINSLLSINDSGQVAFTTSNLNTTPRCRRRDRRFRHVPRRWRHTDSTRQRGSALARWRRLHFFCTAPVLNNAGQVSFWSVISGVNSPERIFRTDGTMLVEIIRDGPDAP